MLKLEKDLLRELQFLYSDYDVDERNMYIFLVALLDIDKDKFLEVFGKNVSRCESKESADVEELLSGILQRSRVLD